MNGLKSCYIYLVTLTGYVRKLYKYLIHCTYPVCLIQRITAILLLGLFLNLKKNIWVHQWSSVLKTKFSFKKNSKKKIIQH